MGSTDERQKKTVVEVMGSGYGPGRKEFDENVSAHTSLKNTAVSIIREDVRDRLDTLEDRVRWQKRAIAGLLVIFLFSAAPALTQAPKWFGAMLPSKLTSLSFRDGVSPGDVRFGELSPGRADLPLPESGSYGLNKIAPDQIIDAGDTLRVGALHVVNASGAVVAEIGSEASGDGSLVIRNGNGALVSVVGVDAAGHGTMGVLNAAGRVAAAMGADPSEMANGWMDVRSATGSAAALAFDSAGDGAIAVFNTENKPVIGFGIDANGHGALRISNAEGGVIAAIGADQTEDANGWMDVRNQSGPAAGFSVDADGDGVVIAGNRDGDPASIMGANGNGHGIIGFRNASGRVVAGMGADSTGIGGLSIEGGRFGATVDGNGNGVAATRANNGEVRWSSEAPAVGDTGTSTGLIGDFDGDGDVDFSDFLTFTANFGKTSG